MDFNENHPEKGDDEIFITNAWEGDREGLFDNEKDYSRIGWKTKRKGRQAYDIYGKPLKNGYPVFVKKSEYEDKYK